MKKMLPLLICCLVFVGFASSLTAPTNYGPLFWACDTGFAFASTVDDTVEGVDTVVLLNKYRFEPGYQYSVRLKVSFVESSTVRCEGLYYGSDQSTLFETTYDDTIIGDSDSLETTSFLLGVGRTVMSNYGTIQAIGVEADSSTAITRVEVWRAKLNMNPYTK